MLTPLATNSSTAFFVNQTEVDLRLRNVPQVVGSTPRWTFLGTVSNPSTRENATVIMLIVNSTRERVRESG